MSEETTTAVPPSPAIEIPPAARADRTIYGLTFSATPWEANEIYELALGTDECDLWSTEYAASEWALRHSDDGVHLSAEKRARNAHRNFIARLRAIANQVLGGTQ